jgi:hypothetical protein
MADEEKKEVAEVKVTNPKPEKAGKPKVKPKAEPKKATPKVVKEAAKNLSRVQATVAVLKKMEKPLSMGEIMEKADAIYSKAHNIKANPDKSSHSPVLTALELGYIQRLEDGKFQLVK